MGLRARTGMNPDSVTVTGGKMQYWTNVSTTDDGWHNVDENQYDQDYSVRHMPYDNWETYAGRNAYQSGGRGGVYHNAALAFKTGSFTGKGKHISISFSVWAYNNEGGFAYAAQLSKHNWSSEEAWLAGNKTYYSGIMTSLPNDPDAVGSKTGTIAQNSSRQTATISLDAEILPDTEYVLYLIGTSGEYGHILTLDKTASYPMTITVTE